MTVMRLCWLLLEAAAIGLFFYSASAPTLAAAGMLVLVPLLSLPMNLLARRHLRMQMHAGVHLRKGSEAALSLCAENGAPLPLFLVSCRVCAENLLTGSRSQQRLLFTVPPRGTRQVPLRLQAAHCGQLRIRIEHVRLYDCFGLLGVRWRESLHTDLTVQPDTFSQTLRLLPDPSCSDESDTYAPDRAGEDLSEPYQLREYAPGDSPRQIHWKLSSKLDRLIIREPSLPVTRSVLVFWERSGVEDADSADAQAEVTATVCRTLLEQSVLPTLGWNDPQEQRCILHELQSIDELAALLPRMLACRAAPCAVTGAELLMKQALRFSHILYIAGADCADAPLTCSGRVTRLLCGAGASEPQLLFFDPAHYIHQLAELEA